VLVEESNVQRVDSPVTVCECWLLVLVALVVMLLLLLMVLLTVLQPLPLLGVLFHGR